MRVVFRHGAVFAFFAFWNGCVYKGNSPSVGSAKEGGFMGNMGAGKLLCNIMKNKFDIFVRYFFMPIL